MAPEAVQLLISNLQPVDEQRTVSTLAPALSEWFARRYRNPTSAQRRAWPAIRAGNHLLLSAPTGSGKTLAAFFPILAEILAHPSNGLRCLYIAPLKALITDVCRALRRCLAEIAGCQSEDIAPAHVARRTGDTSARVRRRMIEDPPDILLTTPESLAVLLTQQKWLAHFAGLRWLIVDEVHSLAPTTRGADLSLSLERLQEIAEVPPQRIGLSATCAPLSVAAQWLAGAGRSCTVAHVAESSAMQLDIEPLPGDDYGFVGQLVERLVPEMGRSNAILVFTNARGLAERLTWALRRRIPQFADQIATHHSSLAAARRRQVERRLKQGRLRLVVSSTSLELGIDIGSVDLVVLIRPCGSVVRLLQRLGRSGHGPGRVKRGLVLTANAGELLEAAVTCTSSRDAQLEPLRLVAHPLDVLCQHLLGMAATRPWKPDETFDLVRRAFAYQGLSRKDFDDCLAYLSGHGPKGGDWLPSRLRWHDGSFELHDQRTARILRRNLGTILADEPCLVRSEDGAPIGNIDEPFADRLQPGDRFLLDGRCLEYRRLCTDGIEVQEVPGRPAVPRWTSEALPLSMDLARRLFVFRLRAAETLRDGPTALTALLRHDYGLNQTAAAQLAAFFLEQEAVSEIPNMGSLLVEVVCADAMASYYVHTPLHRAGNDALARVAVFRLAHHLGRSCTSLVADLGFLLCLEGPAIPVEKWRQILCERDFDSDFDTALADSTALRERFRRVALTALMVLRNPLGARRKVGGAAWPEHRLFDQVRAADPDFVLLRQAAREVRAECCDSHAGRAFAESLPRMAIRMRFLPTPSPFARHWSQAIAGPGESAESPQDALRRLHEALTAH